MSSTSRGAAFLAALMVIVGACDTLFPGSKSGAGGDSGGGQGGSSGGLGGGSGTGMKDPSAYPHNTPGATFPYPQGHAFAHCGLAAYDTDKIATAYTNWKTRFFQGGRVIRPENSDDTASEGIAYGMLVGVYMNDRPMFDALWSYAHGRFNGNQLMAWHYNSGGGQLDGGAATDADQDMAWALLMADKQWGGSPTAGGLPTYAASATALIGAIWSHEVDQSNGFVLKPGDNFGGANQTNPSYFAPSYYKVFARVTGNAGWMSVVQSSYQILGRAAGASGLVPNWVNAQGAGVPGPGNDPNGLSFGYDACRTPWRIALDYCENGETQARDYLERIVGFYVTKSASGGLGAIRDGYTTAGAAPTAPLGMYAAGMAFLGPGGVAAMDGGHDSFVADVYARLVYDTTTSRISSPGVFSYFNGSWGLLSLMTMSGNFWNMAP
jgi:endo-1,4-beta-D-glucanase Y